MAFDKILKNSMTGKEKRIRVTHFLTKNGKITSALNVKYACTKKAALEAREELDNFAFLVRGLKEAKPETEFEFEKCKLKAKDIDLNEIKWVTIGPKGGKEKGFDQELGYTQNQLKELQELVESGRIGAWYTQNSQKTQ